MRDPVARLVRLFIFDPIKNVLFIVVNPKSLQHFQILLSKCPVRMMFLLILDVSYHIGQLQMAVRECSKPFLPIEFSSYPFVVIDECRRARFYLPDEIGQGQHWV